MLHGTGQGGEGEAERGSELITQKVFIKSFCKSRFTQKSGNSSFIITSMKDKLTDMRGNWLLPNDVMDTLCEIRMGGRAGGRRGAAAAHACYSSLTECIYQLALESQLPRKIINLLSFFTN